MYNYFGKDKVKLLAFGEMLWDIVEGKKYPGGAPFNLSAHAAKCNGECAIVSCLGKDSLGAEMRKEAKKLGVNCRFVFDLSDYPTGTVDASISDSGLPEYIIHEPVAYDFIELSDERIDEIVKSRFDIFCFGTLAQRSSVSRQSLLRLLSRLDKSVTTVFCDVNLRQNFLTPEIIKTSLNACNILKLNEEEAVMLAELLFNDIEMPVEKICEGIASGFAVEDIVVTMGEKGAAIFNNDGYNTIEGHKVEVADTIGAGDAFSAVFLLKRFSGSNPVDAAMAANRIAAFVASKSGAIPEYHMEAKNPIREIKTASAYKTGKRQVNHLDPIKD